MSKMDVFVTVVVPLRNNAEILRPFLKETLDVLRDSYANYEMVLVDDASEDGTLEEVKKLLTSEECLRVIRLSRSYGRDVAISAGLESSIGDFVVVMSPDTDPPSLIPEMIRHCRDGSGIVSGVSLVPSQRSAPGFVLAALFHWYVRRFLGVDLIPDSTDFRVLSRQVVNAVTQIKGRYRQLRLITSSVGFQKNSFSYTPLNRSGRLEKRSLAREVSEGIELIVLNSLHPLRFVSLIGLLAGTVNLLYLGYVVAIYLFKDDVAEGWTTLSLQHGIMFFWIFVILTLLCEYVGRILDQSRERPLYFIQDELNSSVLLSDTTRRNVVREE